MSQVRVELTNSVAPLDHGAIDSEVALMHLTVLNLVRGGVDEVTRIVTHEVMKDVAGGLECHLGYQLVGQ